MPYDTPRLHALDLDASSASCCGPYIIRHPKFYVGGKCIFDLPPGTSE